MFLRALAAILALGPASTSLAQAPASPDTLPFRRGQWAAQFGGGLGLATFGVLRFGSPRAAWHVDARAGGSHGNSSYTIPLPTGGDTVRALWESQASASLRVGRRWYQPRGRQVASFVTAGAIGGYAHSASGERDGAAAEINGWMAGVFAELGGTYLVTERLSIGGTGDVSVVYTRDTFRNSSGTTGRLWRYHVETPNIRFVATIYF